MQLIIETADWDALGGHWVEGGFDKFEIIIQSLSSIDDHNQSSTKKLIEVVDLFGRKTSLTNKTVLFYIYDDGSVEKKVILK